MALVVVVALAVAILRDESPGAEERPAVMSTEIPAPLPVEVVTPTENAHHWKLEGEEIGAATWALVLRGEGGGPPILFTPLTTLPVRGELSDASGPVPVRVLTYDMERQFALLTPLINLPSHVEPIAVSPSDDLREGTPLSVQATDGQRHPAKLIGRTAGGARLRIDSDTRPGAAVLFQGRAVGYTVDRGEALPLDHVRPWLSQAGTRNLEQVQEELRQWMPQHVLADSAALLESPTVEGVRHALHLLEGIAPRIDQQFQAELESQAKRANQLMVRLLSNTDPAEALRFARQALARLPGQASLLADVTLLCTTGGVPEEGLQRYLELRATSREHASRIEDQFISALRRVTGGWAQEDRIQPALDLLAAAVPLFPTRADLRSTYASVLAAASRFEEAITEAQLAAQLDPTLSGEIETYRQQAELARQPRVVDIPLDPETLLVRAEILAGGRPVQLVVDTGASLTTVPSDLVKKLGLWRDDLPRIQVETAAGPVQAPVVELPYLTIGSIRVERVRVVVLDLSGNLEGKGLLGLNVLQPLNMRLDSRSANLRLERPRPGSR